MSKVLEEYVDDVMIGLLEAVNYVEKVDLKLMRKVIKTTLIEVQNLNTEIVIESLELAKAEGERDQYKKLWQQSQRLKRELIKKYNLPIEKSTLD